MLISFAFEATFGLAPLTANLPAHTAIYNDWPPKNLRVDLPPYQRAAVVVPDLDKGNFTNVPKYDEHRLMAPPIHVRDGDFLSVSIKNSLMATGLSIHWHGFEMTGHLEFDGVVGITQCPISPDSTFVYEWEVKETPGTYWYHTHSGGLGIDAYNAIMGPLIVHPKISPDEEEALSAPSTEIEFLDPAFYSKDSFAQMSLPIDNLLFYSNERILFFKGGFLHSGHEELLEMMGGLNPPISYNDDKFSIGTYPWNFGTCNGKMREVVPVSPGQTIKFRIFNAGSMYALRVAFDGIQMTVIGSDGEPVEPVEGVDEIILHAAERFDVLVVIPEDAEIGSRSWIRADTLESRKQGYHNGIRAILHIVDPYTSGASDSMVRDPDATTIETTTDHKDRLTYNCYSQIEAAEAFGGGGCIPISALKLKDGGITHGAIAAAKATSAPLETHIVDWQFSASPQFAHFVRIDGGKWYQFAMFQGHSMLLPDYDSDSMLHPNGAVLNVDAEIGAIVIWRNKSSMDHPIHLHGRKMEILDVHIIEKAESCDHSKCVLGDMFTSDESLKSLEDIPFGTKPLKDTFILPAGGAVATRFYTGEPALWFAHCHFESHREDGMAMIMNVGNYVAPANPSWLPKDYPSCDTPFLQSKKKFPSCDCYINEDAVMDGSLTKDHRCSRDSLCFHEDSPQSNLKYAPYESNGIAVRSQYAVPGWAISFVIVVIVGLVSIIVAYRRRLVAVCKKKTASRTGEPIASPNNNLEGTARVIDADVAVSACDSSTAILFINFQNEFCHEGGRLYNLAKSGIEANNTLTNAAMMAMIARENGALVCHAPTVLNYSDDEANIMTKYSNEAGLFKAGTWNAEFTPQLPIHQDDHVIPVTTTNAFSKELKQLLDEKQIKKLLVCGFLLEVSVFDTVMGACEESEDDLDVVIIEDCCVAKSLKEREAAKSSRNLNAVAEFSTKNTAVQEMLNAYAISKNGPSSDNLKPNQPLESRRGSRRSSVDVQVNRRLPTTLDLPSSSTRRTQRASILGQQKALPIAEGDFSVPARRTVIDFEVEGFKVTGHVSIEKDEATIDEQSSFQEQFLHIFSSQWELYRPTCVSLLRVMEVTSLAFLTGALFYNIGNNPTATGFGSINSLLFFSVTLWTFTRMYPAINTYYAWNEKLRIISNEHRYSLIPACLARSAVVLLAESTWPFLYVLVCYPLASMAGNWNAMMRIGLMLALNNLNYISIGAVLGVIVPKVPQGMITSTIIAQASLVAAGFYTQVPTFLAWLRFVSPVYWTYSGIVKSAFHWSDTFQCRWGSSLAGVNSCFIEFHTAINNLKERGINVASFGDEQSNKIWLECIVLVLFYVAMQIFICGVNLLRQRREDRWEAHFERLAEYKALHGNTVVPDNYTIGGIELGSWVRRIQKGKKTLTEEELGRLDELGFVWE